MNRRGPLLATATLISTAALTGSATESVAAPRTLPVYAVQRTGLDARQADALRRAFGLDRVERAADGSVSFVDQNAFQFVPTTPGPATRPDEDGDTAVTRLDVAGFRSLRVLPPGLASLRTLRGLAAAGLVPSGGRARSDHTTLEAVSTTGTPIVSGPVDTSTSYSFTLGGVPLEGPGAKVRVSYDGRGRVTQLRYATRSVVPAGAVPVLDLSAGARRCAAWLGAGRYRATYAYEAPELSTTLERLAPSIRCAGTDPTGAARQIDYVPAAVNAVRPTPPPLGPPRPRPAHPTEVGGTVDVGSEGTGVCSGLAHTGENLKAFGDEFKARSIPVRFSYLDFAAWEDDFKDPTLGGHDSDWTDNVDLAYWQGHGSPNGFSLCASEDDKSMSRTDARWGNTDVEWMSLFTCLILKGVDDGNTNLAWWQRWGSAFDGLHQINSFHTVSKHSAKHGGIYARYLLRSGPAMVRNAWARASIDDQPSDVSYASMGPIGPNGSVTMNDYFHGKGPVGADIPRTQLTGWWYLRGWS
jgi:hypothetical protein